MKTKCKPNLRLDSVLENKICYKRHYWVNWKNWNMDGRLENIIALMLNLLKFITTVFM